MIRGCAHHSSPSAWVTQEWSHRAAPFLLPPATDALGLHTDMSCSMAQTILPAAGSARDAPAIFLCQCSPWDLSLLLPAAGLVERYNGPQKPRPLSEPPEGSGEESVTWERQKGKTWSKEKDALRNVATDVLQGCYWVRHCCVQQH